MTCFNDTLRKGCVAGWLGYPAGSPIFQSSEGDFETSTINDNMTARRGGNVGNDFQE